MYSWLLDNIEVCQAITSICAVIISVVAISFSIIVHCEEKKRTIQSIAPMLNFEFIDLPKRIGIKLRNDGIGVAKITQQKYAGACGQEATCLIEMVEAIECDDSVKARGIWKRYLDKHEGFAIGPNSDRFLLEIESTDENLLDEIRDVLKQIDATILYTNTYDKVQAPLIESFDYFDRKNDMTFTA